MRAQALKDRYKRAEAGTGDHVGRVLVRFQEHGHNDPRGLHDLDLGAAGVGEADRVEPALAGDVDPLPEDADGGEEGPVHAPGGRVDAVRELAQDLAALGDEVVPAHCGSGQVRPVQHRADTFGRCTAAVQRRAADAAPGVPLHRRRDTAVFLAPEGRIRPPQACRRHCGAPPRRRLGQGDDQSAGTPGCCVRARSAEGLTGRRALAGTGSRFFSSLRCSSSACSF